MDLLEVKNRISNFYTDWFKTMSVFEGGTLKIKVPFYDQNLNELVFKLSEASNGNIKVSLIHGQIRYFANSDLLLELAEEGGYVIDSGVDDGIPTLRPANISKVVDPMTVVDSIHNFIEFFYCGQFMLRLTAFLSMMERAGMLEDEASVDTDDIDGVGDQSVSDLEAKPEEGATDGSSDN